jgi:hypothetical protein
MFFLQKYIFFPYYNKIIYLIFFSKSHQKCNEKYQRL